MQTSSHRRRADCGRTIAACRKPRKRAATVDIGPAPVVTRDCAEVKSLTHSGGLQRAHPTPDHGGLFGAANQQPQRPVLPGKGLIGLFAMDTVACADNHSLDVETQAYRRKRNSP